MKLSTDLESPDAIPYFLWDDPMTNAELADFLQQASESARLRMLGKIMRECKDTDVWRYLSPNEAYRQLPQLSRFLGRRRNFWEFLLGEWRKAGLVED